MEKIKADFKAHDTILTLKFMDPSYQIRSVPANADDSYLCVLLASSAVHGAMAGFTGFTSGLVNNRTALLPISAITEKSPKLMNKNGRTWSRVVQITQQPDPLNTKKMDEIVSNTHTGAKHNDV